MGENSAITQRAFLSGAHLRINRLRLDAGLERVFQQVVDISAQALDVARVGVWLFDLKKGRLECKALHDARPGQERISIEMSTIPKYCEAVRAQLFVATSDARVDPSTAELAPYLEQHGITSMLDAAIYREGEVVGVVCHEHLGLPREWKREERAFAATVADLVSNFLGSAERQRAEAAAHELELELKDSQRLDALGRLSAGVAHDLNNLLGTIGNGLAMLKRELQRDEESRQVMALIEEQTTHAAALVEQLVQLGRGRPTAPRLEALDALLSSIELLVRTQFQPPWIFKVDATPNLTLWADAAQFRQVILNLLLNAKEALPEGGVVLLRAREANGSVVLEVIDGGEGIAEANLQRIFDPYFTTRSRGSGIGLSIVQQIVHQHGGALHASSALGEGTTMQLVWPSTQPPA